MYSSLNPPLHFIVDFSPMPHFREAVNSMKYNHQTKKILSDVIDEVTS